MRILLVNPSLLTANVGHYSKGVEKNRGVYPPLGLAYIASVALETNCDVRIYDCDTAEDYPGSFRDMLAEFNPDLVGFYTMTWTFRQAMELSEIVKRHAPQAVTVAGGPNVSCFPKESLELSGFDYAIRGEGEFAFRKFLDFLAGYIPVDKVPSLIYRYGASVLMTEAADYIEDLDSVSFPARGLLNMNKYFDVFSVNSRFSTMVTSRGCPYNCTYCDRKNRMGRLWRARSSENIISEIEECRARYELNEVMFFDDEFVVSKERVIDFCETLLSRNLRIVWECRARVDKVDEVMLKTMRRAGCYRIRYGFESGNQKVLDSLKKSITLEQSARAAALTKRCGIEVMGYFMLGLPEETPATAAETIDFALRLNPDYAIFSKTILIPGSELLDWAVSNGRISKDYWVRYLRGEETNGAPAISTEVLTEDEVDRCVRKANKLFYKRLSYVVKKIVKLKSLSQAYKQFKVAGELLLK